MDGMTSTLPLRTTFGAVISLAIALLRPRHQRKIAKVDVVGSLTNAQREDLGYENPPLAAVSKFDGFELETWVTKQSPEALQYYLLRGIET